MTDLSPKARALIEQSRSALRPSADDRDRVEAALRERLGPEALSQDSGAGANQLVGFAGTRALFRLAIGVCVVGGGIAVWALRPGAPKAERAVVPPRTTAPLEAPPAPDVEPLPVELEAPTQAKLPMPALPSSRKRDPLAQELALLARATAELHRGHAGSALKALEEHQARFPNGILSEERRAARAQALCSIGRVREGRVEQSRLEPRSPAAARAREVCDSAFKATRAPSGE